MHCWLKWGFTIVPVIFCSCSFVLKDGSGDSQDPDAGSRIDGGGNGTDAAVDAELHPFGALPIFRASSLPSDALVISDCTINTASTNTSVCNSALTLDDSTNGLAILRVDQFTVGNNMQLRVEGPLPLVIVARKITVNGVIDVSSNNTSTGAGARDCQGGGRGSGANAGGGAGGGGFAGDGGNGGVPDNGGARHGAFLSATGASVAGGTAAQTPTILQGGCPGGELSPNMAVTPGGGALQLVATEMLEIGAGSSINVGGGGGYGAGPADMMNALGGGGGGSGGMIVLDVPMTEQNVNSESLHYGGGGGGGGYGAGSPNSAKPGEPGQRQGGLGGNGIGGGGNGGLGVDSASSANAANGNNGSDSVSGGGGGGGSAGYCFLHNLGETVDTATPCPSL